MHLSTHNWMRAEPLEVTLRRIKGLGYESIEISGEPEQLWDILGKADGKPVWKLLGGRKADRLPAYASGGRAGVDTIGEQVQSYVTAGGFRAIKMRVGVMASAFNLRLAPHLWAGAPCFFAGLQICAASPASFTIEFSLGANPMIHDIIAEPVVVRDGMIGIPDAPGLGFTMNESMLQQYAKSP